MISVELGKSIARNAYRAESVATNEREIAKLAAIEMYQLMESAGAAVFALLRQRWSKTTSIVVLCGSGNNAGDGFVVARLATEQGFKVQVLTLTDIENYQGDADNALQKYIECGGQFSQLSTLELDHDLVIVDALLGTGIIGSVRANYGEVIEQINAVATSQKLPIISVDLPSGLDANTGNPLGHCIKADVTVTFIAIKQGLLTGQAKQYCGDIFLAGLKIDKLFTENIAADSLIINNNSCPKLIARNSWSHKGTSGFVYAIGGDKSMAGAIRLSAEAALRAGAGLVAVTCHQQNQLLVAANRPELMLLTLGQGTIAQESIETSALNQNTNTNNQDLEAKIAKVDVLVLGPGLGTERYGQQHFDFAIALHEQRNIPMVVDADGLNLLAQTDLRSDNWILTPHPGEAARLLNVSVKDIEFDRFSAVKKIALRYGGVCILKGPGTIVSNGVQTSINTSGNEGMAVGGMGDVLSGILGALILQLENNFDAACSAVFIHGKAADIAAKNGIKGMLASDLFDPLRFLVNQTDENK